MGLDIRWLAQIAKADPDAVKVPAGLSVVKPVYMSTSGTADGVVAPYWAVRLTLPPSVNGLFSQGKSGRRFKTKKGKEWTANAVAALAVMPRPERYPVTVCWVVREVMHRARDIGNCEKALVDAMVEAGVLVDDKWEYVRGQRFSCEPVEGGTGVDVWWEYADEYPAWCKKK